MRELILRCVAAADGWAFIETHNLVKVPGFTEPVDPTRMPPVAVSGLADQLIFQIDQSPTHTFHSEMDGRCTIIHTGHEVDKPGRSSSNGDSRSVNALKAIAASGFIK